MVRVRVSARVRVGFRAMFRVRAVAMARIRLRLEKIVSQKNSAYHNGHIPVLSFSHSLTGK